jgi:hypothetical protein
MVKMADSDRIGRKTFTRFARLKSYCKKSAVGDGSPVMPYPTGDAHISRTIHVVDQKLPVINVNVRAVSSVTLTLTN